MMVSEQLESLGKRLQSAMTRAIGSPSVDDLGLHLRRTPVKTCPGARLARADGRSPPAVVGVAQSVELLVVVQAVAGSDPVAHPSESAASPVNRRGAPGGEGAPGSGPEGP